MKASFNICPRCAAHGRIVLPDSTESREVWTREMGYEDILTHLEAGRLSEDEAQELGRVIGYSYLPKTRTEITHSDDKCPFLLEKIRPLLGDPE